MRQLLDDLLASCFLTVGDLHDDTVLSRAQGCDQSGVLSLTTEEAFVELLADGLAAPDKPKMNVTFAISISQDSSHEPLLAARRSASRAAPWTACHGVRSRR